MTEPTKPRPFAALASSRKTIVAVVTLVCSTAVVLVGLHLKAPVEGIAILAGAITATAWKLIGAIAEEDSAEKSAPTNVAAGGDVVVEADKKP